ncbi:MAG: hypothetical protein AAB781_01135 [Patescibacteria group bacterium]
MENDINNNIPQKPAEQNGVGPVIGSIIVIIVVVIGGFYFWGSKTVKDGQSADIQNQAMSASYDMDSSEGDGGAVQSDIPDEDLNDPEIDLPKL